MRNLINIRTFALGFILFSSTLVVDGLFQSGFVIKDAEARIGRPLTPVSYAGVARRTARRTIYRSAVYVPALPVGCSTVIVNGASLHQCGSVYYQASGTQYVVVEVK